MPRSCIFCGGSPCNHEHLFPDWMRPLLQPIKGQRNRNRLHTSDGVSREWDQRKAVEVTVRCVCPPCNSGWMEQVERAARSVLIPMMHGQPTTLTIAKQRAVTNWVVLKTMIGEHLDTRQTVMSPSLRQAFSQSRQLPPGTTVRLGIYSGRRNVTFSYYTGRLLPDQPDDAGHAYCAVFTILQLAIEVTGFTLAENWKWSDPLTDGGALLTHPASEVVDWPPRLSIDDGVVDDLPRARLNGLRRV